jgi:ABC-type multidrug transport system fused ATPase/permease subunit
LGKNSEWLDFIYYQMKNKGKNKMENPDFRQPIKVLIDELKTYVDLQLEYNKVAYRKKSAELIGQLIVFLMLFGVFVFIIMFLSFAFVNWYALAGGTRMTGFLIVSVFYLFIALILYAFREPLIFSTIRKILGKNLSSTKEKQFLGGTSFSNEKMTDRYLEQLKDSNRKQENNIRRQFDTVHDAFNMVNIAKAMINSGVQAFVTTSNIIRTAFNLARRLKTKNRKKIEDNGKSYE